MVRQTSEDMQVEVPAGARAALGWLTAVDVTRATRPDVATWKLERRSLSNCQFVLDPRPPRAAQRRHRLEYQLHITKYGIWCFHYERAIRAGKQIPARVRTDDQA